MDFKTALLELDPSRGPVKLNGNPKQSKVAARRTAPPLPFIKTPSQDSSQQHSAPRKQQAFTPHPSPYPFQSDGKPSDVSALATETVLPLKPGKSTKSSLFSLFSKPNVEQARGYHETDLESPKTPGVAPSHSLSRRASLKPLPAPPKPARASSITSTKTTSSRRRSYKPNVGSHRPKQDSNGNIPCQLAANWEPPPLLQAYPQALCHCLMRDPDTCFETNAPGAEVDEGETSRSRPGTPLKRRMSTTSRRKELESRGSDASGEPCGPGKQNIYILVTSGYILQYAGDGPCERKPQKILKLCAESAAFASDLIPGKPYVLQVLQKPDDSNINIYAPKKSLLSKVISASHLPKRRYVRSMILVFSDPNEMNGWMESIRKEVDRLSGRRNRPDTAAHHAASETTPQNNLGPQRVITLTRKSSMESSQVSPLKSPPLSPATNISEGMSGSTAVGTSSEWSSTSPLRHPYGSIRGRPGNNGPQISTDKVQKRPFDIALPSPARIEVTRSSTSVSPKKFDPDTYQMPDLCPVRSCESISTTFTDAPSESSTLGGSYHTPMSTPAMDAYAKIIARRNKKNESKESNDSPVDINAIPDSATLGGPNNAAWHPNVACASPGTSRPPSLLMSPKGSPPRKAPGANINTRTSSRYFDQRAPEIMSSTTSVIPRSHPPIGNAFAQQVHSKSSDNLTQRPSARFIPPALPLRRSFQSTQDAQLYQGQTFSGRRAIRSPAPLPLHATAPKRTSTYFQNSGSSSPAEAHSVQPSPLESLPEAQKTDFGLGINVSNSNTLALPNEDSQSHRASTLSRLSGEEPSRSSSKRSSLVGASARNANGTEASEARPLRRPSSILINPDPVPLLAKRQSNSGLQMSIPVSGMGSDAIFGTAARASRRTSTRVPVVRPPSVARAPNGLRFSRSTPALPPAQPPPEVPLPPPPPQALLQQAAR